MLRSTPLFLDEVVDVRFETPGFVLVVADRLVRPVVDLVEVVRSELGSGEER